MCGHACHRHPSHMSPAQAKGACAHVGSAVAGAVACRRRGLGVWEERREEGRRGEELQAGRARRLTTVRQW